MGHMQSTNAVPTPSPSPRRRYRPSRNILVLSATSFLNDLSSEMVLSVFPAFFVSVLRSGAGALGFVEGLAEGASNIIKIVAGRLSDRLHRRKPFVLSGYALSVATRPAYVLVSHVAGVAGLRFLDRVGKGLRDSPRDAIISLSTPDDQVGRAFGIHRAFDTLGAIGGPLIAYLILRAHPGWFHGVFLTAFFVGIAAVLSLFLVRDVVGAVRQSRTSAGGSAAFSPEFKRYLASLSLLSLGNIPVAVLLLKTQSVGLTLASIPLFYLLYNCSYAGFSYSAGSFSDRFGPRRILIVGYLALLVGYAVIGVAQGTAVLVLGFLLLGFFPALTDGVQRALASELSLEAHRGAALGYVNAVVGAGLFFAGIGGGYLWQHAGTTVAFTAAGGVVVLGIILLLTVRSRT